MEDDNEDELKNKEDLHIAGMHTALDIFCFAVFFSFSIEYYDIDSLYNEKKNNNMNSLCVSNLHLGQKSPWTNISLDQCFLGQKSSWTNVPWTKVSLDKCIKTGSGDRNEHVQQVGGSST